MKNILKTIIIAVIGGLTVVVLQKLMNKPNFATQQQPSSEKQEYYGKFTNFSANVPFPDFTSITENGLNSVVHVKALLNEDMADNPLVEFFFGYNNNEKEPVISAGSGVIISSDGYIVTNNHVISKNSRIKVVLNDKRSFYAKIIGKDESTDIALLKIEEKQLPHIRYGNSENIKVGEWALAIGNPFNLTSTVTAGIISAKARNINLINTEYAIESFIQTDAAVNAGNSGGALINIKGELIGINTAIASRNGTFNGYSFAVPVNIARKVVDDLIEYGAVQRALLGISIINLNAEKAKKLNLNKIEGVYVKNTVENGAAMQAGIKKGDLVTHVASIAVNKVSEFQEQISKYRPGDEVLITIKRNNKIHQYNAVLQNKQGNTALIKSAKIEILGAAFEELTDDEKNKLNIENGVKVVSLSAGKLLKVGVEKGFIITKINHNPIKSISEIKHILQNYTGGVYIEGIKPNGKAEYFAFGINNN